MKPNKLLLLLILFFNSSLILAQGSLIIGNDMEQTLIQSVIDDNATNGPTMYLVGRNNGSFFVSSYAIENQSINWTKQIGGLPSGNNIRGLVLAGNNNDVLILSNVEQTRNAYLTRISEEGDLVSALQFQTDNLFRNCRIVNSGEYYIIHTIRSLGAFSFDDIGNINWAHTYDMTGFDQLHNSREDGKGGLFLFKNNGASSHPEILHLDKNGEILASFVLDINNALYSQIQDVMIDRNGNLLVLSFRNNNGLNNTPTGEQDDYTALFSAFDTSDYSIIWERKISFGSQELNVDGWRGSIQQKEDEVFISFANNSRINTPGFQLISFVLKVNANEGTLIDAYESNYETNGVINLIKGSEDIYISANYFNEGRDILLDQVGSLESSCKFEPAMLVFTPVNWTSIRFRNYGKATNQVSTFQINLQLQDLDFESYSPCCEDVLLEVNLEVCKGDKFLNIPILNDTTIIQVFPRVDGCDSIIETSISLLPEQFIGMSNARDTILSSHVDQCDKAYIIFKAELDFCGAEIDMKNRVQWKLDLNNNGTFDFGSNDPKPNNTPRNSLILDEYLPFGTHLLEWTFESPSGEIITERHLITVVDNKPPTPVCIHGIAAAIMPQSGMITLPAFIWDRDSWDNCTEHGDLVFSFSSDPTHTFHTWTCDDLQGEKELNIPIEIWVTDKSGHQDYCITYILLQDNQDGCPEIDPLTYSVSGLILNLYDHPINEVIIQIKDEDAFLHSYQNHHDGSFSFNLVEKKAYKIAAERNTHPLDGISTLDLILIQKHILGLQTIDNPYSLIAADINGDKAINVLDLQILRDHILGNLHPNQDFQQWKIISDWNIEDSREVPKYNLEYQIDELTDEIHNLNLTAIKMGDVNSSHLTIFSNRSSSSDTHPFDIYFTNREIKKGEKITVRFMISENLNIQGVQSSFTFDPKALEFLDYFSNSIPLNDNNFGFTRLQNGFINLSWYSENHLNIEKGEPFLEFHFLANKDGLISQYFNLSSNGLVNEFYSNGEPLPIKLSENNPPVLLDMISRGKAFPNPFSSVTNIPIKITQPTTLEIEIFDISGKKLYHKNKQYSSGPYELKFDRIVFPGSGVYFYTIQSSYSKISGRLVLIE